MKTPAILLAAAASLAPLPALADSRSPEVPAKARALADRGRAFHDAGDYGSAITAFTQAYVIAPSPALLFNLAQAYRLQGNCDDAALMYRRYLTTNPPPEQRALAESHLAHMERCLHKIALHIPVEAPVGGAAIAAGRGPIAGVVAVPPPARSRRAQIEKDVGVGMMLGGSAALGAAAYFAIQAHDAERDVADAYQQGGRRSDIAAIDARGQTAATRATVLGIGGALSVTGGVLSYLLGRSHAAPPVTVASTRHGVELGVRWAF